MMDISVSSSGCKRRSVLVFTVFIFTFMGYIFGESKMLMFVAKRFPRKHDNVMLRPNSQSISMLNKPLVVAGPSGVGKGTLIKEIMAAYPSSFGFSVSHTSRSPRPGEEDGKDYYFSNREQMMRMIENGDFLEYAEVHNNFYGTSRAAVQSVQNSGKICILDVDVQGVQALKQSHAFEAFYLFIAPPSMHTLEERLRGRNTESEEAIQKRIANANAEVQYGIEPGNFDEIIINNDLQQAVRWFEEILKKWYPAICDSNADAAY